MYNCKYETILKIVDSVKKDGRKNIDVGRVIGFQDGLVEFIKLVE